jgi:hypothetical protein
VSAAIPVGSLNADDDDASRLAYQAPFPDLLGEERLFASALTRSL